MSQDFGFFGWHSSSKLKEDDKPTNTAFKNVHSGNGYIEVNQKSGVKVLLRKDSIELVEYKPEGGNITTVRLTSGITLEVVEPFENMKLWVTGSGNG